MAGRTLTIIGALLLTAGCVSSSGIIPVGPPNTYTLKEGAAPLAGGGVAAQRVALAKANAHCRSQGREMLPISMQGGDPRGLYGDLSYSATFRCLLPTDLEFSR